MSDTGSTAELQVPPPHRDGPHCPTCGPRPTPTGGWPDDHDQAMQALRREQFKEMR